MAICNNKKCSLGECDQPETCAAYVPVITNADRIRAMSDGELAKALYHFEGLEYCRNLPKCVKLVETGADIPDEKCIGCVLAWLRETAEVNYSVCTATNQPCAMCQPGPCGHRKEANHGSN